jgi:hypothetical protein
MNNHYDEINHNNPTGDVSPRNNPSGYILHRNNPWGERLAYFNNPSEYDFDLHLIYLVNRKRGLYMTIENHMHKPKIHKRLRHVDFCQRYETRIAFNFLG